MFKTGIKITVLLITTILCFNTTRASHVMAGEITYKYAGNDSFVVFLKAYRDCNGIAMSSSSILVKSGCSSKALNNLILYTVRDVTGIPAKCGIQSRCTGSFQYGIEEYVYVTGFKMPNDTCCKYIISWEQCCRNGAITTGASGQNFYIETTLDKCLAPHNNSPSFLNLPIILAQVGQDLSLSHTAVDNLDNDFITYELTEPLAAHGAGIAYSGSWSADKPVSFLGFPNKNTLWPGGFRFDTLTANMVFRATKATESTVVTIKAKEWRKINGKLTLISETIRDVQLVFFTSTNNKVPKIDSTLNNVIKACAPGNYCLTIPVTDADANDTLVLTYKHNLKNVTFTKIINNPNDIRAQVCFTVDSAMMQFGSYYFTLYATDNACTLPGKSEKTWYLRNNGYSTATLPKLGTVCETQPGIQLFASPSLGTWSGPGVNRSSEFNAQSAGKGWHNLVYHFKDSLSRCPATDSIWVRVTGAPKPGFTVSDTITLKGDTIVFTDTTVADTLYNRLWTFGDGLVATVGSPRHAYAADGIYAVKLVVKDSNCPADTAMAVIKIGSNFLSIKQLAQNGLKLYPSPADNLLHIETQENIKQVEFIDVLGRVTDFTLPGNSVTETITVSGLKNGVYLLTVADIAGNVYKAKVLVQR